MRRIALGPLLFVTLVTTASQSLASLVVNGGFEDAYFVGWSASDPTFGTFVSPSGSEYSALSGDYFAALGATGRLGSLSQTLNTVAGTTYTVNYFLASDGNAPNEFKAVWGGTVLSDLTNIAQQSYTEYRFTVTATSSLTTLTFFERNDNGYLSLDDVLVNISTVPEPTSMVPLGAGLAAVGGYSLLRRGKTEEHPAGSD